MNKKSLYLLLSAALLTTGCSTRGVRVYKKPEPQQHYSVQQVTHAPKKYTHPTMRPYVVRGIKYYPTIVNVGDEFDGYASWYGPDFHGKLTSSGEVYNMHEMTAAHKTLPMNTILRVINHNNGLSTIVRVNDRGPFVASRIIDLSNAAAKKINMIGTGTAPVTIEVLGFAGKNKKVIPSKEELATTKQSTSIDEFALQIASFSNIKGAIITQEKYDNTDGYHTVIKDMQTNNGRMFKVWLKGFKSEQEARDYKDESSFKHAFIVRED